MIPRLFDGALLGDVLDALDRVETLARQTDSDAYNAGVHAALAEAYDRLFRARVLIEDEVQR